MALNSSLRDCAAYIYDENGFFLLKTRITAYDGKTKEIEIDGDPGLKRGAPCRVTVETSPLPWEYMGRVSSFGARPVSIALYNGKQQTSDDRLYPRFKAHTPAVVESFIGDGGVYALHAPFEVSLVDISQSGLRIIAPENMMAVGARFKLRLRIGAKDELLIAEAVNSSKTGPAAVEYGCRLCGKSEDVCNSSPGEGSRGI